MAVHIDVEDSQFDRVFGDHCERLVNPLRGKGPTSRFLYQIFESKSDDGFVLDYQHQAVAQCHGWLIDTWAVIRQ